MNSIGCLNIIGSSTLQNTRHAFCKYKNNAHSIYGAIFNPYFLLLSGSEDCLYLNIYVPEVNPPKKLDVVVHIHAGCFMWGYNQEFLGDKYFMDRDVILVSMNYRLNAFGKNLTLPLSNEIYFFRASWSLPDEKINPRLRGSVGMSECLWVYWCKPVETISFHL